jgi:hypothetical protein
MNTVESVQDNTQKYVHADMPIYSKWNIRKFLQFFISAIELPGFDTLGIHVSAVLFV